MLTRLRLLASAVIRRANLRKGSGGPIEDGSVSGEGDSDNLNLSLRRRLDLLQAAMELVSQIGSLSADDEIARRTVVLARELLGVEWAGLILCQPVERTDREAGADEGLQLVLAASGGEGDVSFGSPGKGLDPNTGALVARCIDVGQPQVVEASGREWTLSVAPAAMPRRSVLLVPLRAEEEAMGALVLSPGASISPDAAFTDAVGYAAGHVALALQRAGRAARLQARADDSERVVRRYVEESWDGLVASQPYLAGYRYTPRRSQADGHAWLPAMTRAVAEARPVVEESAGDALMAVPLVQSGIIIGVIGLRRPESQPWSEDEQLLVRAASEQTTQALENRRLFELAHDRAQRERLLRQITERIRSQANLDGALRVAIEELRNITGTTHIAIRLGRTDRDA